MNEEQAEQLITAINALTQQMERSTDTFRDGMQRFDDTATSLGDSIEDLRDEVNAAIQELRQAEGL